MIFANIGTRLAKDESGATAVEYGLIVSLIVIALIGAFNTFANESIKMWEGVTSEVQTATNG
ncbi:Flp family type IVb pilin [Erythrobacteraceae bacterium E2-1 Yellow Sea]|nr:Flp family type IVb pilin [Erythrobacteraceae bacterium E2-1 Yellow Sea]